MRNRTIILCALLLVSPFVLVQSLAVSGSETTDRAYSLKSSVTYVNPADSGATWNFTEDDRIVGLFMNTSWQNVELRSASYALKSIETDADGNRVGVLDLPRERLLPGENMSVTVEYQVVTKSRVIPGILENESGGLEVIPGGLISLHAGGGGPWLVDDPTLLDLARDIKGSDSNVLTIVKNAVSWIRDNIAYRIHEVPFYANQTVTASGGDCDDQAVLLITLLRILGIPSYLQIGAIYSPQNAEANQSYWNDQVVVVQRKIGWHGWAEVYIPPWGWLPVDLTYVYGGLRDPLDAIRHGAVTEQNTVQYMNISKVDYVADSRDTRSFILENGFLLFYQDEMAEVSQDAGVRGFNVTTLVILVAGVASVVLVTIVLLRRRRRKLAEQEPI